MQISFFQIAAGIFPHQFDRQVPREHLTVMRMTAQLHISTGCFQFLQLFRLVFQYDDRFGLIQITQDLLRLHPVGCSVTRLLYIFSSHQIKSIVDQRHFVIQHLNPCFFCKFFKPRITHFIFFGSHGKSAKQTLRYIVIAEHTERTISALDSRQRFCDLVRILQRFVFIIKNISCKYHQIRILF